MLILLAIVLAFWSIAAVLTALNLSSLPRLTQRPPRELLLVSVIIPARNEARAIGETVARFLAQTSQSLEVIVVNDRSTDGTAAALRSISSERLAVIEGEEPPPGWLGKPWALHQGSLRAKGDFLLFVDADVHYEPEAVERAVSLLQKEKAALLALFPRFEMRGFWEAVLMPQLALTFFCFFPLWLSNRSRKAGLAIGAGSGNLVERSAYLRAGGHTALKAAVVDDIGLARLLRNSGEHTICARADDYVSVRMYHGAREIIHGFTKNAFATFSRRFSAAAIALVGLFVFHLLPFMVWPVPRWRTLSLSSVLLICAIRLVLFRSLRYPLWSALMHPLQTVVWGWIMIRSIWYTGFRNTLMWRGRAYDAGATNFGGDEKAPG